MRIREKYGLILESQNPLVIEQWKKAGFRDIDEEEQKPEEMQETGPAEEEQEVKPAEEEKPKKRRKTAE